MANYENLHDHDDPRFEPWLGVMCSAFVPAIIGLYLPPQYVVAEVATMTVLVAAGLLMLRRQMLRRARERRDAQLPSTTSVARSVDGETLEMQGGSLQVP